MLYELRIYHCPPGRLPDLLKFCDTVAVGILQRHGIEQAGFWTTVVGESNQTLAYLLKWGSLAEREKKWTAFQADPERIAKFRAETESNGPLVARVENYILQPTAFSAVK
jgi:NIPSNAP protein